MNLDPTIPLYNPSRGSDEAFLANFVARRAELDALVASLRATAQGGAARHEIVVGARGMGKTSLLRRLAIAVGAEAELAKSFVALRFREEQYNVISLATFWRNCCDALAEWCEAEGRKDLARRLDAVTAQGPDLAGDKAEETFLDVCRTIERRAVLLLDNLDIVVDNLKEENWRLRTVLQSEGGPIVVGAATQFLDQSGDRQAPFYEFFRPHVLEPLTQSELLSCLRALATARGERGKPVLSILERERERALTLYALTGGNPRVVALIYQLLERADSREIFADLEALLDQVTPFYKARVEEYEGANQRAIIDAVALNWDPITSNAIEEKTGIPLTTISSVLNRLKRDGFIEEVQRSGARAGYQIAERFLNIWYLMRHGTRQLRQKLRWLTLFLTKLFSEADLERMADESRCATEAWSADWRLAVEEPHREVVALRLLPAEAALQLKLGRRHTRKGDHGAAIAAYDELIAHFGEATAPEVLEQVALALLYKGVSLDELGRREEAIGVYNELIARFGEARALLYKGVSLDELGRHEEAIGVYNELIARFGEATAPEVLQRVARALFYRGATLRELGRREEAIDVFNELIARFGEATAPEVLRQVAWALIHKGATLYKLGRREEAIGVYNELIARFGEATAPGVLRQVERAHGARGRVLADYFGCFDEAEDAYRAAMSLAPEDDMHRANLAWLLLETGRATEADPLIAGLTKRYPAARELLDAGREFAADNFGLGVKHLAEALDLQLEAGVSPSFEDLLRLLRLAVARGHGERLIAWFEESGNADRYAPVHGALVAKVRGEQFLRDLNPEVRKIAEKLYAFLSRPKTEEKAAERPRRSAKPRGRRKN